MIHQKSIVVMVSISLITLLTQFISSFSTLKGKGFIAYILVITITDPPGQNVTDTVLIQVLPSEREQEGETTGDFFQQLDWTFLGVGGGVGFLFQVLVAIVVNALHKPKSKKKPSTKRKAYKNKK